MVTPPAVIGMEAAGVVIDTGPGVPALRPGDLITAINGTPLDDPSRGEEVMRTIGSAPEVRVTIMRNGRQNDMVLNMAQIATEAEQLSGTEGITPIDQAPQMPAGGTAQ